MGSVRRGAREDGAAVLAVTGSEPTSPREDGAVEPTAEPPRSDVAGCRGSAPGTLEYLLGSWSVERTVHDVLSRQHGTFSGTADCERHSAGGCSFTEHGLLRWKGRRMQATRSLRLDASRTGVVMVSFEDGRPFHALDLRSGRYDADHRCGPDLYHGHFEVHGDDEWTVRWDVIGPRKQHSLESVYRRAGSGGGSGHRPS